MCAARSRCGAAVLWRPRTGPVALRGGRLGAATAPPARGPGTRCANGVGSAMASPPRLMFTLYVHSFDRDCHVCEHPQRARDPWPEASTSAKSGSLRTDYSRVPPGRAVVVEAERSRVERGRPRDRGPARSGGCGRTSTFATRTAFERPTSGPARGLAPVALRGGRHGAATAPPARGPGTRFANGVGSAMASPPRVGAGTGVRTTCTGPSTRITRMRAHLGQRISNCAHSPLL
jgi:hypothetical protein